MPARMSSARCSTWSSEYTSQVAVDGDIMTTLAQNLADFVTEFQTYGVRFAHVLKRLADLLERVKGVVLNTTPPSTR